MALLTFLGVLTETSMNVTFPTLMTQFNVSLVTVQWVTTGYLLVVSLLMLTSAFLNHRFTNRQLFVAAGCLFIAGDIICAVATSYWILLMGRLIQAGCVGLAGPLMTNMIIDSVPTQKLGQYLGLGNLIVLVGPALGPSFGGLMVSWVNWRLIFWASLPIALVLVIAGMRVINSDSQVRADDYHFNWLSFSTLSGCIVSGMLAISQLSDFSQWRSLLGWTGMTLVFLALFIWRTRYPTNQQFIKLEILKSPLFLLSFIPYILMQFVNLGINFLLPNFVQIVDHAAPLFGGLILLPGSIINGFGQPLYGWILDKYGGKLPLYGGNLILMVIMLLSTIMLPKMSVLAVAVMYTIFALGRSLAFSNTMTYGLKKLAPQVSADANAVYSTGQQIAGALGTNVVSVIVTSFSIHGLSKVENVALGSQAVCGLVVVITIINCWCYFKLFRAAR